MFCVEKRLREIRKEKIAKRIHELRKILGVYYEDYRKGNISFSTNDYTCPKCQKGNIVTVVKHYYGVADDQVLFYYCNNCYKKFSFSELMGY